MHVVGTAGHVDHGKSTLVTALTGINPDRLKEEQAREMTIELGFAWLSLPDGETVGVVDVPGHRDFIENMLAGVGGIDAVLFVIAADEGIMPQTREHLAILDLLQIPGGLIVVTKADLIDDPEWFDLLEMDIRLIVQNTVLTDAPIIRVSARRDVGLQELKQKLAECLAGRPPRADLGRPRLSIDRVFSMQGFGTVVTGTLLDGQLHLGDEVVVYPDQLRGRVRGLQTHKQKVDYASPGSRTAINISGIDHEQVRRGDLLTLPGKYQPTERLDVFFHMQKDVIASMKHNASVKLFLGAAEVPSKIRLLGGIDEVRPGSDCWLQVETSSPVVAIRGDRFILRRPSPGETLGGGAVIDPHPAGRHKRSARDVIVRLESLRVGSPRDILWQAWLGAGIAPIREVIARSRLTATSAQEALDELVTSHDCLLLENGKPTINADLLMACSIEWQRISSEAVRELATYHRTYPLRKGMSKEEFRNRLKLSNRAINAALRSWSDEKIIIESGSLVSLADFKVSFTEQQQRIVDRLLVRFDATPFTPPSVKECIEDAGEEIFAVLIDNRALVQVSQDVVFRTKDFNKMLEFVREHLAKEANLTVAQFRDRFNTSRKYVLGFLEYLDSKGVTRREGDFRVLGRQFQDFDRNKLN